MSLREMELSPLEEWGKGGEGEKERRWVLGSVIPPKMKWPISTGETQ
jgi:hypothetical protein